jgi:MFS family permease
MKCWLKRLPETEPLRDRDFARLWLGESISLVGSQVTGLALPLTAILLLDATPSQMGLLIAVGFLPFLVFTLPAGVWVDRRRRRPILIGANIARALLLALIPAAAVFDLLRIELLYAVSLATGVCTVAAEVGLLAYVPSVVSRDALTPANARLQASASAAYVGGPGLAGILVSALSAPLAIVVDAASYLVAAISLVTIRRPEPAPVQAARDARNLPGEVLEGLRATLGHPLLRAFAGEATSYNLLWQMVEAVILLYLSSTFHFSPATIGLLFGVGAVGALLGSVTAGPIASRLGLGRTVVGAVVLSCVAPVLMPLAAGSEPVVFGTLAASLFLASAGVGIANVHVVSIRQAATPSHLLGRMNASYRTAVWGAVPIGALIGGLLGDLIGLRETIAVAVLGLLAVPIWIIRSPVPALMDLPTPPPQPASQAV